MPQETDTDFERLCFMSYSYTQWQFLSLSVDQPW